MRLTVQSPGSRPPPLRVATYGKRGIASFSLASTRSKRMLWAYPWYPGPTQGLQLQTIYHCILRVVGRM